MRSEKHWNKCVACMLAALLLLAGCRAAAPEPTGLETADVPTDVPTEEPTGLETADVPTNVATEEPTATEPEPTKEADTKEADRMIYAHVNGRTLSILPENNTSAEALIELLKAQDVTVDMHDYGSFEKVGALGAALPRNDEQITTEPGDVILYQGDQITIYYDVNSWRFTRLGKVQGLTQSELREILGDGNATVTFSLSAAPSA